MAANGASIIVNAAIGGDIRVEEGREFFEYVPFCVSPNDAVVLVYAKSKSLERVWSRNNLYGYVRKLNTICREVFHKQLQESKEQE